MVAWSFGHVGGASVPRVAPPWPLDFAGRGRPAHKDKNDRWTGMDKGGGTGFLACAERRLVVFVGEAAEAEDVDLALVVADDDAVVGDAGDVIAVGDGLTFERAEDFPRLLV